jgi:hypothetical protein
MSQVSSTIHAPAVPAFGSTRQSLAPIAVIAVLVATIAIAVALAARPAPVLNPRAAEAADGWEAGLMAQNAAVIPQGAQDGYLAGLLSGQAAGDAVDGSLPGYAAEHQIMDGWEAGLR